MSSLSPRADGNRPSPALVKRSRNAVVGGGVSIIQAKNTRLFRARLLKGSQSCLKITARLLMIGVLAIFGSTSPIVAQPEPTAGSFLVYVTQATQRVNLSPSEHLLVFPIAVQIPGASLPPGPYIFRLVTPSLVH